VADELIRLAGEIGVASGIDIRDHAEVDRINDAICRHVIPAVAPASLTNILNAGWKAYHKRDIWSDHPEISERDEILKELLLKSIEVLEFMQITSDSNGH